MEDLSPRKPPQLAIKAEDTTPTGENGALVWSTQEGRLLSYNENAGRYGVVGVYPALSSVRIPGIAYNTFTEIVSETTLPIPVNTQQFVPFYLTRDLAINTLGYSVSTAASSGSASVGIYNTQVVNGISMPYELLTSATGMNITSTGIKTAAPTPSITLRAGILYWVSIYATGNVTLNACVTPTRMVRNVSLNLLVSIRISNSSGSLVNPAPSTSDSYTGFSSAPILVYT